MNIQNYNKLSRERFSNNFSEIIINEIVNKIIIIPIYISENKIIDSKISEFIFNFSESIINNVVSWNIIKYDKDEIRKKNKEIINDNTESQLFQSNNDISQILSNNTKNASDFIIINSNHSNKCLEENKLLSNCFDDINDWNICEEPKSSKYDRYSSSLMNMIYIKNEYNKNYFEGNKINKIVKEEKYEEEGKKSKNNSKKSLKNFNSSTFFSFKSLMMNIKKPNIQKKINEIMNEFSFHSIEDGKDDKYMNNLEKVMGFEKLRKEFEIKKELNQLELKKMKKKKVSLLEKFKMEEENNKKYRGKKITKDHNGEIIFIKKMKLENLKKEFFIPKTFSIFIKEEKKEKELTNKNLSDISTFEKDIIKDKIKSKENRKIFNKLKTLKIINESKKNLPLINKPKRAINIEYNKEGNETEKLKDIGDLNNKNQNNKIKKPLFQVEVVLI